MSKRKILITPMATLLAVFLLTAAIISCEKVDDSGTVSRNGLPMNAAAEIQNPPVVSSATGTINVAYDKKTKQLSYTLNWNNLTSDSVTGSHIHGTASRTQNASVVHPFTIPATRSGTYSGVVTVDGVKIKEDSLLKGFYYFNIHTNRYKGGEIRGQIEF